MRTTDQRKLAIQGFDLANGGHNFFALMEFDISGLRKQLRQLRAEGKGGSLFAAFLKAVGTTVDEYPLFNSMIDYQRTTTFEGVDVAVPVEVSIDGVIQNRQHIIRRITEKSLEEITSELAEAKANTEQKTGFIDSRAIQSVLCQLPRSWVRLLFRSALKHHSWVRKLSGTVFVTSVTMYSSLPGFVIPFMGGPKAVSLAFGSVYRKPVAVGDRVEVREVVSVTAVFNHDLIDGAPAARFLNRLRSLIEVPFTTSR